MVSSLLRCRKKPTTLNLPFLGSEKSRLRALNLILGVARFWLRKESSLLFCGQVAAVTWAVSGKTLTVTNVDPAACGHDLKIRTHRVHSVTGVLAPMNSVFGSVLRKKKSWTNILEISGTSTLSSRGLAGCLLGINTPSFMTCSARSLEFRSSGSRINL